MGELYRLFNTGQQVPGYAKKMVWVEIGQPIVIGNQLVMTLLSHSNDGEQSLVTEVRGPGVLFEAPLPASTYLNAEGWAGLLAIPRAAYVSRSGRFEKVLMEFVIVRDGVRFSA